LVTTIENQSTWYYDLIETLFQAEWSSLSAHRSIVCLRKSSCYTCCTHCTSVFCPVTVQSLPVTIVEGILGPVSW